MWNTEICCIKWNFFTRIHIIKIKINHNNEKCECYSKVGKLSIIGSSHFVGLISPSDESTGVNSSIKFTNFFGE